MTLFGEDLFANPVQQNMGGTLANKYLFPPFSILNTMDKRWQKRKRQWLKYGIKSELGRSSYMTYQIGDMSEHQKKEIEKQAKKKAALNTPGRGSLSKKTAWKDFQAKKTNKNLNQKEKTELGQYCVYGDTTVDRNTGGITGTSIFDPVLCELMYNWFCPKGGQIVDPFAGGSVRGLVATHLGFKYWGCDLRKEQIEANYEQAVPFFGKLFPNNYTTVKISAKSLNQKFKNCTPEYITENCKGRCCQGSGEIKVAIHKTEKRKYELKGAKIKDNYIIPDERGLCPFKQDNGLCSVHEDKPFGCEVPPFTLNKNNTLIVRNRYRLLKCYKDSKNKYPAYISHKRSLVRLFGEQETKKIIKATIKGKDCLAKISYENYRMLIDNNNTRGVIVDSIKLPIGLKWVSGDSNEKLDEAPDCDFIFTCPPYGNLEIYSDDDRDISNMKYDDFLSVYKSIIYKACSKLKENRFACIVVGDFRDKKGLYYGFVADTIKIFQSKGLNLYNEFILSNAIGSLPVRIQLQFDSYKKIGKMHQNILVFYKGDPKKIKEEFKE